MENNEDKMIVIHNQQHEWGVVDVDGNIVVPFGKYGWIDRYEHGLARVRTRGRLTYPLPNSIITRDNKKLTEEDSIREYLNNDRLLHPEKYAKWGIIDESGNEVVPCIYDSIWSFAGKNKKYTKAVRAGVESEIYFEELQQTN